MCPPQTSALLDWRCPLVPQPEMWLREGERPRPASAFLGIASAPGTWGPGVVDGCWAALNSCPYPIRLFQMNVGPPKKLEELDPETWEYWRLLRKHNMWRHNRLSKNRKF